MGQTLQAAPEPAGGDRPPEQAGGGLFAGRFRAAQLLKSGNGVETWLGEDVAAGASVVIKTAADSSLTPAVRLRLEHEAAVLREVRQPSVAVLHFGRQDDRLYLVMPFVPGVTLEQRLHQGPLSVAETIAVGRSLMAALRTAHEQGVLHRDVKPANIIVDQAGPVTRATLIDFGLARSPRLDGSIRDRPVGTARYMSPEQAGLLDAPVEERADLYSAGVVLFECLAGRPPFQGSNAGDVLRQHMTARPPELRGLGLAVPRALDEIVQRLLRKDPRERYQSAEAVAADLAALADALARGVAEPALVVGLHDRRRTLTVPAFVGRGEELARLDEQLEAARAGRGGLVLLESASGGGKSRLLAELAQRAWRAGACVLRGEGLDQAAQRPFQLLVGIAHDLVAAAQSAPGFGAALAGRLGDHRGAVCAALPELAAVVGRAETHTLGPETFAQARTLQALTALLDALGDADRPTLVVLDDCQWADELTVKLLADWQARRAGAREGRHVLAVVAFRSEEVPPGHPLRGLKHAGHLRLAPFGPSEVRRLAESMAGELPAEAVAVVERLAQGSPFMAAAVLQGLAETGALVAGPAGWQVEPLAMADVQSSRHAAALLARRVELLPAAAVELLSAAAVLGKEFDLDLAVALAGQTQAQAAGALDEAGRRHLVWSQGPEPRWAFVHDKIRHAFLERLDTSQRRELHRRAALYLEAHEPGRTFELAYHFDAAGDSARALPYATAAAERARAQHSLEVAEQQYRIAARGARDADDATRGRLAEGLGEVLMLRGRYHEAAREFATARVLAQADGVHAARIEGKLGELAFKRGDGRTAREHIERALALLGRRVPRRSVTFLALVLWEVLVQTLHSLLPGLFVGRRPLARAGRDLTAIRLYSRLAHLYWFHLGTVPSLWAHLRGMNLAERYPPTAELAQAYSEHAPGMSLLPWFRRGIAYAEKSLTIRRAQGDVWGEGQSLHFLGVVLYASSRFQDCIDTCRKAVRLLERTGDFWEVNIARYQIAASLYRLGDLAGAVRESRRMYQSGLELGDAQASGISLDTWARASLGALPAATIAAELARPSEDVQRKAQVLAAQGVVLLREGTAGEAAGVFEQAHALTRAAGVRNAWVAPLLPWLATARRVEAEQVTDRTPVRRRALLRRAAAAARRAVRSARYFRNDLPRALREAGIVAAAQGRRRAARRHLDASLAEAERQGAAYEQALTRQAWCQVGRELGWPGAAAGLEAAEQAVAGFEAVVAVEVTPEAQPAPPPTLSLADRFETVMDAGRKIASALSRETIFAAVREGALRLLRGERCLVLRVGAGADGDDVTAVSGEVESHYSQTLVRRAVATGRAITFFEGTPDDASESALLAGIRSALCAPIFVRGRIAACLYVTHRQVAGLFGEVEERLADFIGTIAGAALENAEGFADLRQLNDALERRIEERKQAEKRIQEQAALLDRVQDAILVTDLEGRIGFWNRSAERLYGWSADEAAGRVARGILYQAPPPALDEADRAVLERGEWAGELRQVTRAGKEIIVESRWTLVRDDAGRPKSKLVVNTDITERRRLEAQFLRAQRLESLGTLAGGVAHDLNNILTPILMGIEMLAAESLGGESAAILADLQTSVARGADMVKQILAFARGTAGEQVRVHLRGVVKEVERMVRRTFPGSVEVRVDVPEDLAPVKGDPTQLYQMLLNLCVNARDAMPHGGVLTITTANQVLDAGAARLHPQAEPGPHVVLTVLDTGTGIAPELVDRIFDPFFTTKAVGKGTGLGLSNVLGIVKGHRGFVTVQSVVGKGSQFSVYLPADTTSSGSTPGTSAAAPGGKGQLILVVDDEEPIRKVARQMLEARGYRVVTAGGGAEAVELYRRSPERPDLVLTDMLMPGMDGPATVETLRGLCPGVRVIASSGVMATGDAAPVPGVAAVLPKPYTAERLLAVVSQVLGGPGTA